MIELTERAAGEVKRWQKSRGRRGGYLRIEVKRGGCAGLYYDLGVTDEPGDGDRVFESRGVVIALPGESYALLRGLKLDYAEDLMGGGFRFQNPNVHKSCGCGLSFSGDD